MRTFAMSMVAGLLLACGSTSLGPCNASTCEGCCSAAGQCEPGNTVGACGNMGGTCRDCSGLGLSCNLGSCSAVISNTGGSGGGSPTGGGTGGGGVQDAGTPDAGTLDAGTLDAGTPDGVAMTRACTNTFGAQLSAVHGRLDGLLVAVVPPGGRSCNGDADHVHLQVLANGSVYDVAVNVRDNTGGDVFFLARDGAAVSFAWVEGWHPYERLGYPSLGLSSGAFTAKPISLLAQQVENELATVNHVSIFATGYGPSGVHNVHYRDGVSSDGAIIARPLSGGARTLFFHFANQSF